LVIKDEEDQEGDFTFIESVTNHGVSSNTWKNIKNSNFFEKICMRHLTCERDPRFYDNLDQFIDEVWAHNYALGNPFKINRSSEVNELKGDRKFVNEDRTFFCSELVAKAYKSLGVFDTPLPS